MLYLQANVLRRLHKAEVIILEENEIKRLFFKLIHKLMASGNYARKYVILKMSTAGL
jgi:hypothetical protein